MAQIWRCDRCGKDHTDREDLTHVSVGADKAEKWRDYNTTFLNRTDVTIPVDEDVCRTCAVEVLLALRGNRK